MPRIPLQDTTLAEAAPNAAVRWGSWAISFRLTLREHLLARLNLVRVHSLLVRGLVLRARTCASDGRLPGAEDDNRIHELNELIEIELAVVVQIYGAKELPQLAVGKVGTNHRHLKGYK